MTLLFRPFLDPIELHGLWWVLLIPLALGISVVYKAVRLPDAAFEPPPPLAHPVAPVRRSRPPGTIGYGRAVLVMTVQIIVGMALLALGSFVLVEVYAATIAAKRG